MKVALYIADMVHATAPNEIAGPLLYKYVTVPELVEELQKPRVGDMVRDGCPKARGEKHHAF